MKKIFCVLLAVLCLVGTFASCNKKDSENETTVENVDTEASSGNQVEYDERGYQKDNLPNDLDYGGQEVRILGCTNRFNDFEPKQGSTDNLSFQVFNRNAAVEDRFGVELVFSEIPCDYYSQTEYVSHITNLSLSGENTFDLYSAYSMVAMTLASQGKLQDLAQCNYIDFKNPWWPDTLVEQFMIGDSIYGASGDITLSYYENLEFILMNKELMPAFGVAGSPIEDVRDGSWTVEKMLSYAEQVAINEWGDDKDGSDTFGLVVTNAAYLDLFIAGCNFNFIHCDENGDFALGSDVTSAERGHALFSKLTEALYVGDSGWYSGASTEEAMASLEAIAGGRVLFTPITINSLGTRLSEGMDYDYLILPAPKYDTNQKNYYTVLSFEYNMYMIPNEGQDIDVSALVMEALASEGYRKTTPELFEIKVKNRFAGSDPDNAEMFELLRNTTYFEHSRFLYRVLEDNRMNPISILRNCVANNSDTWASKLDALKLNLATYLRDDLGKSFDQ